VHLEKFPVVSEKHTVASLGCKTETSEIFLHYYIVLEEEEKSTFAHMHT
jgi:hypothetical protein